LNRSSDAIEERYAELGLGLLNLARCRRLAQVQSSRRAVDATGFSHGDKGAEMTKVRRLIHFLDRL
jgi:hypothetical protein